MVVIQLKIWQLHIGEELVWSVALKAHDPGLTPLRKHSYFSAILTLVEIKKHCGDKHDKTTHVGENFDFVRYNIHLQK